jgi:hypothetical protein
MPAADKLAKAMANLIAASYAEAVRPTAVSGEIVDIAANHFAAALDGFKAEIASAVADEIDFRRARTL